MRSFQVLLALVASLQHHVGAMQQMPKQHVELAKNSFRQVLDNDEDVQYLGNMTVGGQLMQGIFDTGSIEFAVLSDKCRKWCGKTAPKYHAGQSRSYRPGNLSIVLSYGSGQLSAFEAYETVEIGSMTATMAPFWEVQDAHMPLLLESNFETFVGLGPVPPDVSIMRPNHGADSTGLAVLQKKMLIERFSICMGHQALSPGYLTWNDPMLTTNPSLFTKLQVADNGYWMVELLDVELGEYKACSAGCGAVIDSGTSLLAMPESNYEDLNAYINSRVNCGNIGSLPDLRFRLDGIGYSLPPDSYVGEVFGDVGSHISKSFKLIKTAMNKTMCQATLMEINLDSTLGDVWILGVPFFRRFYTTFVQATDSAPPAIYTAPAQAGCRPGKAGGELLGESTKQKEGQRARRVRASKLRVGPWIQRAKNTQPKDYWELNTLDKK